MSRLVDPTICPDCRAPLDPAATCTACGLRVSGPLASELWATMVAADSLVERLRAATLPRPASPAASAFPATPPEPRPARRRLPAMSVPVVLLSLGALCLLVAAVVFVAVTWSALGITGRTLILLGFTALLAVVAVVLTRRGLRGAAETFWLVVAGMLTTDLLAAESAGLAGLDALSWRGTGALVGGALLVLGGGVAWWAQRQPVRQLHGPAVTAVVGALLVALTNGWLAENPAVGSTIALAGLAGAALLLARPLPVVAVGLGNLAAISWVVVLGHGTSRAGEVVPFAAWWSELRGWPLLVAAAAPSLVVLLRSRTAPSARIALAAAALLPLVILANSPASPGSATREQLVRVATLAVLALVTVRTSVTWSRAAAVWTGLGVLVLGGQLLLVPWTSLATLPFAPALALTDPMPPLEHAAAAWTWLPVAAAVALGLWSLSRLLPGLVAVPASTARDGLVVVGVGAGALGALTATLGAQPPLWVGIVAACVATAVMASITWLRRRPRVPGTLPVGGLLGGLATAHLAVAALVAAEPSEPASALVATLLTLALVISFAALEDDEETMAAALTVVLAGLGGCYAVVEWAAVLDADPAGRALAVAGFAALLGVGAALVTVHTVSRVALEATALAVGLTAVSVAPDGGTSAMVLTVLGSAIAAVAILNRDRAQAGWAGAVVLLVATAFRVDLGVTAPELYTLPAAVGLVAVGLWRLQTDRDAGSLGALGSGLTLALLPSLLLSLEEPVSLRGALTGLGGVVVLALGVQRRLSAPLLLGAGSVALLAVRHLEPYAEALPRWVSLGALGLALLAVGITWESRLRNLHAAKRYLMALR